MRRRIAYVINHMDVGLWRDTHLVLERRKFKSKVQKHRVCSVLWIRAGYFVSARFFNAGVCFRERKRMCEWGTR